MFQYPIYFTLIPLLWQTFEENAGKKNLNATCCIQYSIDKLLDTNFLIVTLYDITLIEMNEYYRTTEI